MTRTFSKIALVAALEMVFAVSVGSATQLNGQVDDVGAKDGTSRGIAGVLVKVFDEELHMVGQGITSSQGYYEINQLPVGNLVIQYRHEGYVDRPTVKHVAMDADGETVPVIMMRDLSGKVEIDYVSRVQEKLHELSEDFPNTVEGALFASLLLDAPSIREFDEDRLDTLSSQIILRQTQPSADLCNELSLPNGEPTLTLRGLSMEDIESLREHCVVGGPDAGN